MLFSELEDRALKTVKQKLKEVKTSNVGRKIGDSVFSLTCVLGVLQEKERREGAGKIVFEEIIAENYLMLMKPINPEIQIGKKKKKIMYLHFIIRNL